MKIAIIGSGIAGLAAAWSLGRADAKVTLFERGQRIGFDGNSVLAASLGGLATVDVPLRLHNSKQWPELFKLFQDIGVETVEVDASQTFCDLERNRYLRIPDARLFSINPSDLLHRWGRRIVSDIFRFRNNGIKDLQRGIDWKVSFDEYLNVGKYSEEFRYRFLFPVLSSTVCTCSYDALSRYPATILVKALERITDMSEDASSYLFRARLGARDVVEKLSTELSELKTCSRVESVRPFGDNLVVRYTGEDVGECFEQTFDNVIFATQANHAAQLLDGDYSLVLNQFEYENVEVFVHRDENLMPRRRSDWSTFNMRCGDRVSDCSIWLQKFYGLPSGSVDLFQTINPVREPDGSKVLSHVSLQRPVVRQNYKELWGSLESWANRPNANIWLTGSYATEGVPLLESGVVGSLDIAEKIKSRFLNVRA